MTYDSVLPDPVLATPIKSLPDKMTGIACACMGEGLSNRSLSLTTDIMFSGNNNWDHLVNGGVTLFPLTRISSRSIRNKLISSSDIDSNSKGTL